MKTLSLGPAPHHSVKWFWRPQVFCGLIVIALLLRGTSAMTKEEPGNEWFQTSQAPIQEERKSVILHRDSFKEAALAFAFLHREFEGVEAILISVDEIDRTMPAQDLKIPFKGWASQKPKGVNIRSYDFALAQKIMVRLRQLAKQEKILAVLILGDGEIIPPSYYFYRPFLDRVKASHKEYNEWIASDRLYGTDDFEVGNDWGVGRISVSGEKEALEVARKYHRWQKDKRNQPFSQLVYFAGNIHKDMAYSAELLYLLFEQKGIAGPESLPYLQSNGRFTESHLEQSLAEDNAGVHFIFTHGTGDGFAIGKKEKVSSRSISRMPYKPGLSLIVSPSCMDGGFDYDLVRNPVDRTGFSVGEAILRSEGAGIGYLGASRVAIGKAHYALKDGEVDMDALRFRYMPSLLVFILEAHHWGYHRIADAIVKGREMYHHRFPVGVDDKATFDELTFLGDPVVTLPAWPPRPGRAIIPELVITTPHHREYSVPIFPVGQAVTFALPPEDAIHLATVDIIDVRDGDKIVSNEKITVEKAFLFAPKRSTVYLIRTEFNDGSVNWLYVRGAKV